MSIQDTVNPDNGCAFAQASSVPPNVSWAFKEMESKISVPRILREMAMHNQTAVTVKVDNREILFIKRDTRDYEAMLAAGFSDSSKNNQFKVWNHYTHQWDWNYLIRFTPEEQAVLRQWTTFDTLTADSIRAARERYEWPASVVCQGV